MKLTTGIARNLEPPSGKTDHFEWDEDFPGFGVRVRVGRNRVSRKWVYQYDIAGRSRRVTLGNVNAISVQDARKTAGQLHGKVRLGRDPMMEKAEGLARAADTFASVMVSHLKMAKVRVRTHSWNTKKYHLTAFCRPLHPRPLTTITRREIAAVLAPIAARNKLMLHNAVRGSLLAFFNWAIEQGLTESNPVVGTIKYEETSRERVLSLPELAAIWHAVGDIPLHHHLRTFDYAAAVRLLMLTGQREGEIGHLQWCEVVGDTIVLPAERTKNKREHRVPLSQPAQAILLSRPRGADDEAVLRFQGRGGPFTGWSWCKLKLDSALIMRGHTLAHWVHHDLRRSVATHMGEMGIQPHVIEAALNHVSGARGGIAGVYNRSKLEDPKRQALTAWADLLMMHVEGRAPTGDKVVSLAELKGTLGR